MIGRTISHYEILEKLGEGGMGVVYKARDRKLERLVALKFLSAQLVSSPEANARFLREARAISALNHPNIATIHSIDQAEDQPFLVLEFLPGGTLRSLVQDFSSAGSRLPLGQILAFALQMGEGLAHAHRHGIVHRDVKSGNALFGREGTLKITDFGLSKLTSDPDLTRTGTVMGTVAYMSPEQALGRDVDRRSDIFSFGVMLFEMAAGRLPFAGQHESAVVYQIVHAPAPALGELRPDAPPEFERIVSKALRKEPENRYQSMDELVADLRALAAGHQPATHPRPDASTLRTVTLGPGAPAAPAPGISRRKLALWTALPAAALLVLALGLAPVRERLLSLIPSRQAPAEKKLAVLPFRNVGGDPSNQAFCDGLMETLTSTLTQLEQFHGSLWVVPASEVRGEGIASARAAQRAFGVNLVVSGSVQRAGNVVRLTANLIDAVSLQQLGSRSISRSTGAISDLQEGVTGQVADLLEVQLNPEAMRRLATGGTRQGGAYELYLQGRGYLQRTDKTENVKSAVRKFSEALRLDPQYALAHAGLGEAYLAEYSLTKEPQWLEQALSAADRATELNDRLPAAHIDSGVVQTIAGKYEEAIRRFQRALELDPVNASAYRELGKAYAAAGRISEAESTYQRAIRLRPSFWLGYKDLGVFYYKLGRYAAAEPAFRKVIELTPDNALGYRNLGGLYHLMGRYAEAETTLKKSLAIQPSNSTYLNLGTICFFQGRFREAVTMYEKAIELGAAGAVTWGNLGDAYRWTPEYAAKAPAAFRRAIQAAEAQLAVNPNDADVLSSLAVYRAKLGDRSRSLAEVEKARRLAPSDQNVAFTSVLVFELAGKRERALAALKEALGAGYSLEEARREPELAELRKDPRCRRLLGWGS